MHPGAAHLAQRELCTPEIGGEHEGIDATRLLQPRDVRLEARRGGEHRVLFDYLAPQPLELTHEAESQTPPVIVVEVHHADAPRVQHVTGVARELRAVTPSASAPPRPPPRALISLTASSAARRIETPRGWANGPANPRTIGPLLAPEQAVSRRVAVRRARHLRMSEARLRLRMG